jgi:diacylglycerol kinase
MLLKSFKSFRYAVRGIGKVIKYENNAKVHLMATITVIVAGAVLVTSIGALLAGVLVFLG